MLSDLSTHLAPFHPRRFPYGRFAATLALGLGAGLGFQALNVPLPWMLGPLMACTAAVLANVPVSAPAVTRPMVSSMIGVMLGSTFSPQLLAHVPQWIATLVLQQILVMILALIGVWYYRKVAGLDPVTAYYAGMPGGMLEMSLMSEERGGDGQAVILIHSARILFIILTVPFIVQGLEHVQLGPRQASRLALADAPATTFLWLAGLAIAGPMVGRWLRLPARFLFGPMFLSIAAHGLGFTDFQMPREIVIGAQILLGCVTGCRFAGYAKREIIRILIMSLGATALLLATMLAFSFMVSRLTGTPLSAIILAFAPAGIAEMSLVALALHFDVAFVLVHQLARILVVASSASPVFRWLGWPPLPK